MSPENFQPSPGRIEPISLWRNTLLWQKNFFLTKAILPQKAPKDFQPPLETISLWRKPHFGEYFFLSPRHFFIALVEGINFSSPENLFKLQRTFSHLWRQPNSLWRNFLFHHGDFYNFERERVFFLQGDLCITLGEDGIFCSKNLKLQRTFSHLWR